MFWTCWKVDQGFISALIQLFTSATGPAAPQAKKVAEDKKLVAQSLQETAAASALSSGPKSYYDYLHFSPIKIHISFSLQGGAGDGKNGGGLPSEFLNVLLKSFGVTLTDIQDVVFKLGYFERSYTFYTQRELTSEVTSHYSRQAIAQMYVLVLGLDVLGNPFGLIRGLGEGVQSLFYEPYQGAIQGPEEFAEGLALGVRSLFSSAVGGAAGAAGRITGTLGKGLAALTMDQDYQRKRQQAINKRPADFKEGLAQGGKGLLMGVVDGVTGVVLKPVEGAKQEGVEGFFKGMGKGLIGVVARPTSGVIDFASGTLEGIKRVTDLTEEVRPIRPPRYFHEDGVVRAYVQRDAEGSAILRDADKGKFAATDAYIAHLVLTADFKFILIVTDRRVLMVSKGEIFGQWDCDWAYLWSELKEAPINQDKNIRITLREKQKKTLGLFGTSTAGKNISVGNPKAAEWIVNKMRDSMRKCQNDDSLSSSRTTTSSDSKR